jgi:hypothetical protein
MGALRNDLMYISGGGLYLTLTLTLIEKTHQTNPYNGYKQTQSW